MKKMPRILIVIYLVTTLFFTVSCTESHATINSDKSKTEYTYKLSPDNCQGIFLASPEEFVQNKELSIGIYDIVESADNR